MGIETVIGSDRIVSETAGASQIGQPSLPFGFARVRHSKDSLAVYGRCGELELTLELVDKDRAGQEGFEMFKRDHLWPILATVAFLHAALNIIGALIGEIPSMGGFLITFTIGALAVGVWRRRLWAVYALALYELLLCFGGAIVIAGPLLGLAGSVLIAGSPSALSPKKVTDLPLRRIIITAIVAWPLAVLAADITARLIQIKLGFSAETENALQGAITYVLWVITFALAARKMPWSLETVLGAVAVAFLLLNIDTFVLESATAGRLPTSGLLVRQCHGSDNFWNDWRRLGCDAESVPTGRVDA